MEQQQRTTAQELRRVAEFVETTSLDALDTYSDIPFPLVHGDLKTFPRSSPEARAAERGFDVLRQDTEAVVTTLYALAAAMDNNLEVPEALLVPVLPYIEMFRVEQPEGDTQESAP